MAFSVFKMLGIFGSKWYSIERLASNLVFSDKC